MKRRLALACLLLAGCNGMELTPGDTERKDAEARAAHYEEAAKTYYDGGRYEAAALMWQRVLQNSPDDPWAKFGLAKSLQMVGTPQSLRQAEEILDTLLPLEWTHPTRGDVRFEVETTQAMVYSDLADFYDRDARALADRLENDPDADPADLRQKIELQERMRDDLLKKSIPLYRGVLSRSEENPFALAGLAKAHLMAGNEALGIQFAERYVRLSQESQKGWRKRLAEWEQLRQGDVTPEQRNFYLTKIHGAREKEMKMHLLLGSVHMRRDEFHLAVDEYDQVIELDAAMPAAYLERAQAQAAQGRYPEAVADLEQYLKMTDPQKQRRARVAAAELLDRYKMIVERQATGAATVPAALPARSVAPPSPGGPFPARAPGSPPPPPPPAPPRR
jgi:tetratricopeptide (TPR) repeat protein